MIQNQLVGAPIGQNITLECISEAFPKSINYWMRSSRNDSIIVSGKCSRFMWPTKTCMWIILKRFNTSMNDFRCWLRHEYAERAKEVQSLERRTIALALRAIQSVFMHETRELNLIFITETGTAYMHSKRSAALFAKARVCGHTSMW